ncbi:MAG TPA: TolC family protein [Sphingobacteriaceae bacterium]
MKLIEKLSVAACNAFLLTAGLVLSSGGAKAQEPISLQQAIEIALQNNLQVKQVQLNEALSVEDVRQSRMNLYPSLGGNSSLNFNFGRSVDPLSYQFVNQQVSNSNGSLFSSVTLFQGFQKVNIISQNKLLLEADKSSTRKAKNDLALNVAVAYLSILTNEDLLTAARQQLEISQQQLKNEQQQFDVGAKTTADLSQSRSQVATAELNVTNAQNALDIAYLNLAQLMERDPASKFEIVRPQIDEVGQLNTAYSAAEVYTRALQNYPDIKLAEFNRLAAAKAVSVAKGNFYPSLELQGSIGSGWSTNRNSLVSVQPNGTTPIGFVEGTNQVVVSPDFRSVFERTPFSRQLNENFNQSVGFSLSIPLFNNYASRISVRKAKITLQNYEVQENLAKNNLNKVISQAVLDLRAAEKRYHSAQSAFKSSQEAFNAIRERYGVGLVNSLDMNQAQTNFNKAQFDVIQARYDLIFRSKVIDFYLGNPLTF